ncbi:response regulator [Paenibacillus sp. HB172176]|uniref:response regulator n=1 Tax=Paenibacillus sp. HB172176 TaxID=2493690 RepID=UPI00143BC673|nr:response regulator [Paenibacillus sp. HB172176]
MIKVLVIDDEFLVRVGLKTFIAWKEKGFELIGEATNGREALELLRRFPCDIILTDICMPEMDGLELLEQVRKEYPHIQSIILTNHDEFKYVRKALQLGAIDYVLKLTMEPKELEEKLMLLKEEICRKKNEQAQSDDVQLEMKRLQQDAREKRFREIVTKSCSPKEVREVFVEFGYDAPWEVSFATAIKIDGYGKVAGENRFKSEKLLHFSVRNIILELLKSAMPGELIETDKSTFTLLTPDYSSALLTEMRESIGRYLKLSVSFGVSRACTDYTRLHEAYKEAEAALEQTFYAGAGQIIEYDEERYGGSNGGEAFISWTEEDWSRMIEQRDEEALLAALERFRDKLAGSIRMSTDEARERWILLIQQFSKGVRELDGDIYSMEPYRDCYPNQAVRTLETLEDIYEWFRAWVPHYLRYVKERSNHQWRPEIRRVVHMIREQYMTQVKVSDLAKAAGFTEAYLSVLFKKETGETVIDCLIRHRMDKARELLKSPGVKIYEVSEAVGYTDPNYFAKLFKKMEGIYPLEYRKKYLNKE